MSDLIDQLIEFTEGQATREQARKYLQWSRNNIELALNYHYQAEERKSRSQPKPKVFTQLMEGAKKQSQLEKIIKQLKEDYDKPIQEAVTAAPCPHPLNFFENKEIPEPQVKQVIKQEAEPEQVIQSPKKQVIKKKPEQIQKEIRTSDMYLGSAQISGYTMGSHNLRDLFQKEVDLILEPQTIMKKVQKQQIIRISFQGREIGRISKEYEMILGPLLERKYITIRGFHNHSLELSRTMDPIYLKLEVYLHALTELKLDSIEEEQHTFLEERLNFQSLYDLLNLKIVEDTLIEIDRKKVNAAKMETIQQVSTKKVVMYQDDPMKKKPKQQSLDQFTSSVQVFHYTAPQIQVQEESADINYEKLLALEQCQHEELQYYEPVNMKTQLYDYQKQALTWLLQREGFINDKQQEYRLLHPLWRQYQCEGGIFYFNPFSGQSTLQFPHSAQRCKGGILADEMGLGKTVMFIALINANQFSNEKVKDYIQNQQIEKQKKQQIHDFMKVTKKRWCKTLIVVPLTLLSQWESEIQTHCPMKVWIYYGSDRGLANLPDYDVVLTTYGTVSHEYVKQSAGVFSFNWFRVILDEAHYIKGRTIQLAQAVYSLDAYQKWCSTGTPVQNKLDDLFSLLHFIKLEPWSDYLWWNNYVNKPYESGNQDVFKLLQIIMKPILLRRTKKSKNAQGRPIIDLKEKIINLCKVEMSPEERDIYTKMEQRSQEEVNGYMQKGVLMSKYMKMFELLLRLRQICDHPFLITTRSNIKNLDQLELAIETFLEQKSEFEDVPQEINRKDQQKYKKELIEKLQANEDQFCPVCLDKIEDTVITTCLHLFCRLCISGVLANNCLCPCCRMYLSKDDTMTVPRESQFTMDWRKEYRRSAKIEGIMDILSKMDSEDKCVIFTQFIGMIELIEFDLERQNKKFLRLDGKLNQSQRASVLKQFKEDDSYKIFIVSLKAGGVGLNLTMANTVILVDPWWNPAVEEQAIERVYRIGQTKVVHVYRVIVKDSVEERILEMHKVKQQLFDETIMDVQQKSQARVSMLKQIIMGN